MQLQPLNKLIYNACDLLSLTRFDRRHVISSHQLSNRVIIFRCVADTIKKKQQQQQHKKPSFAYRLITGWFHTLTPSTSPPPTPDHDHTNVNSPCKVYLLKMFLLILFIKLLLKIKRHEIHKSKNAGKVHLLSQQKDKSLG